MGLIITLLIVAVLSGRILVWTWGKHLKAKEANKYYADDWVFGSLMPFLGVLGPAIAIIVIMPSVWLSTGAAARDLTVFYDSTVQNYRFTIEETANYLSSEDFLRDAGADFVLGSVEKLQLATAVSERIAEYRDDVGEFNSRLGRHQYMQSNFFMFGLYQRVPDRLKPIVIGGQ